MKNLASRLYPIYYRCVRCSLYVEIGTPGHPRAAKYCSKQCRNADTYRKKVDNYAFKDGLTH